MTTFYLPLAITYCDRIRKRKTFLKQTDVAFKLLPRLADRDRYRLRLPEFRLIILTLFLLSSSSSPTNCLAFERASFRILLLASSYVDGNNSIYLYTIRKTAVNFTMNRDTKHQIYQDTYQCRKTQVHNV